MTKRPKAPKMKRGRKLRTIKLSNIAQPVIHKMKAMSSRAVVHKRRGTHKTAKSKVAKSKTASTPESRSIKKAQVALERAARPPRGHKHERKIRTVKFSNIETTPRKASKTATAKADTKKWYS